MDEIRHRKLEEQIREELSSLIMGGEVKDPRVGPFVSLTRVEAARDLSYARVFVSSFAAAAEHPDQDETKDYSALELAVDGLNRASGFMQSRLARRLRTRLTPKLQFVADKGIREGFELNERIKGLFT